MTATTEIWRPVPGYDGLYEVSSLGAVRSLARTMPDWRGGKRQIRARMLRPVYRGNYRMASVTLRKDGVSRPFYVHILLRQVFSDLNRGEP